MNDEPPDWVSAAPPTSDHGGGRAPNRGNFKSRDGDGGSKKMTADEITAEARVFHQWLEHRDTRGELAKVLPDYVDIETFIANAKAAVLNNPELLKPELRSSLLLAVSKAAVMGLRPDGKEGALVPRWDRQRGYQVVWQPMVWGIVALGRRTGAIKSIRAVIVFKGENFEVDEVEGTLAHRRDSYSRQLVDEAYAALRGADGGAQPNKFLERIDSAYCVIDAPDGTRTMRWMPGARILLVRASSKAQYGPWSGPFVDEMVLKTIILWTSKWLDLDVSNPATQRFRSALETDMDADFDAIEAPVHASAPPALAAPGTKLDGFESLFRPAPEKETVEVAGNASHGAAAQGSTPRSGEQTRREPVEASQVPPADAAGDKGGGDGGSPPPDVLGELRGKRWPDVRAWALNVRLRIEQLSTEAEVEAFRADPEFDALYQKAVTNPKAVRIAEEIGDALDDRITYLRQMPPRA